MSSVEYLGHLYHLAPEAILGLAGLVILVVDRLALLGQPHNLRAQLGGMVTFAACIFATFWMTQNPLVGTLGSGMVTLDAFTIAAKQGLMILAAPTALLACDGRIRAHTGEFFALLLFSTIGMMLMVSAENLLMIFVCLELATLPLYMMACFDKSDPRGAEAALKYFLFGGVSAAFTLFGMSLIFGYTGTLELSGIAKALGSSNPDILLLVAISMTIGGLGFKVAAAPFHLWAPDVYQTSPIPAVALIAAGSKLASFFLLAKFVGITFLNHRGFVSFDAWRAGTAPVLALLATASMLIGNLAALRQTSVRRLLAYSAISHAGYVLLIITSNPSNALGPILFYTFTYGLSVIGAFAVVGIVSDKNGSDGFDAFDGLFQSSPFLSLSLLFFLLSMAGIPPLAGFFGKFYLFGEAVRGKSTFEAFWLIVMAMGTSSISLYYYLKVLKRVYVSEPKEIQAICHSPAIIKVTVLILALAVLILGILPNLVLSRFKLIH